MFNRGLFDLLGIIAAGACGGAVGAAALMLAMRGGSAWIGFAGSVVGGLLTLVAGYFALSAVERERHYISKDAREVRQRAAKIILHYIESTTAIAQAISDIIAEHTGAAPLSTQEQRNELADALLLSLQLPTLRGSIQAAEDAIPQLPAQEAVAVRAIMDLHALVRRDIDFIENARRTQTHLLGQIDMSLLAVRAQSLVSMGRAAAIEVRKIR